MANNNLGLLPLLVLLLIAVFGWAFIELDHIDRCEEYAEDYGVGAVVTTTAEYEIMTNDSFTGIVVVGAARGDHVLTVRNRDGVERRIATQFLEPVR